MAKKTGSALDGLLDALSVSSDTLTQDIETLPKLFMAAAEYQVEAMRAYSAADMDLDKLRAETDQRIRQETEKKGQKTTEPQIKAMIEVDHKVLSAYRARAEADALHTYGKLLTEAFRIKRDCIHDLVSVTSHERALDSFQRQTAATLGKARKTLQDKYPGRHQEGED